MKNKKRLVVASVFVVVLLIATAFQIWGNRSDENKTLYEKLGKNAVNDAHESQLNQLNRENDIYMRGENAVITNQELELETNAYIINGENEDDARDLALAYAQQRNALYAEAIKQGFQVTDDEIWDYLETLKEKVKKSNNASDIQTMIDQFDTEDEFWNYEFTVYKKNLPIQKLVDSLKKQYGEENDLTVSNDTRGGFSEFYEQYKADLVAAEHYQLVSEN